MMAQDCRRPRVDSGVGGPIALRRMASAPRRRRCSGAPGGAPPAVRSGLARRRRFVLGEGVENELANVLLCARVGDGAQQREAPALAVDGVLPRGGRDVPAPPGPALPDREADQLQAGEDAVIEVELRVGELYGRVDPHSV
jgi:hypothetical protein